MPKLDSEEREIEESFERDEWRLIVESATELERYRRYAQYARYAREIFENDSRVNICVSGKDLKSLQKRALEEGLPYQPLMASVLHTYLNGRLIERSS